MTTTYIDGLKIPTTRSEALEAYAGLVGSQWGAEEADYVRRTNRKSFGLLMTAIAFSEHNEFGQRRTDLAVAARAAQTDDDRRELRKGG